MRVPGGYTVPSRAVPYPPLSRKTMKGLPRRAGRGPRDHARAKSAATIMPATPSARALASQ
eukprot:2689997-Heterocapsa_arctica.AAC.1